MKRQIAIILSLFIISFHALADEGMWLISTLSGYTMEQMKQKGFKLSAQDIYNINNSSLKDAVVIFGRGCTGEIISSKGLVLTNHHCGYSAIQSVSTVEHDYLTDGFWAMSFEEELPIKGLTVTFLDRVIDVTEDVLDHTSPKMTEARRKDIIQRNIQALTDKFQRDFPKSKIVIKPFFYGNQYFLFVYNVFKDIRLVGAPPSSIGKFGGDTDNWMWPRHTGDFSIFRIYAGKNNQATEYNKNNKPYSPKKHLQISLKGYKEGDFTMVLGYPGRTSEYLPSIALVNKIKINNHGIKLRREILDIYDNYMKTSHKIKLQYSAKYARIANYWKKWIGENNGLKRTNAIQKKKDFEKRFIEWTKTNHRASLSNIFDKYKQLYEQIYPSNLALTYFYEGLERPDLMNLCRNLYRNPNIEQNKLIKLVRGTYKNLYLPIDKNIFVKMLKEAEDNLPQEYKPAFCQTIKNKYKGDYNKYANYIFSHSLLTDTTKLIKTIKAGKFNPETDALYKIYSDIVQVYNTAITDYIKIKNQLDSLNRIYIKAQMDFEKDKHFYPDANFTMRLAFGQVKGYNPTDAVEYNYFTTLKGIIEKEDTAIYDYKVPERLKEIYYNKDYGEYADADGTMHVCLIATNHTTGGNSGSPVLDAYGRLIGVNFDRNWEGTMSDLYYDPTICRNIILDIRYFLLIVDKFANDKRLIEEMDIVK